MSIYEDLKLKYKNFSIIEKLIAINVVAFLLKTLFFLFGLPPVTLIKWLGFPKELMAFLVKPWTIITYAFVHADLWHILSNMIILYFSGNFFINYFSGRRALTVYLLGAISGALLFMLSFNLFPAFTNVSSLPMIGASAAVMAILIAIATYIPNMGVRLMFLGTVKFWWIAAFFVFMDIARIPVSNAGGHIAHLGGAIFGYWYAIQAKKEKNIGSGFENMMDKLIALFSFKPRSPLKTVYKAEDFKKKKYKTTNTSVSKNTKSQQQEQIDKILDKISKSGYDSLTKQEKDFLFKSGKNN
ncbi:rhomboid family intramembrane serine protease [Aquimarina rhabdastrellae]